jgi:aryl-alcohol dehydrogenase-like predicted oxidoreductase
MRYLEVATAKKISKIGLGTWQFGAAEWGYGARYADGEAAAIVRRAVELGVTLFDTAEIYGAGRSERILGRALGGSRGSVLLATKIFPVASGALAVRRRAEASARRLGASFLDLYQVHWPSPLARDESLMRGMRSLRNRGLVGEVGVSSYSLRRWQLADAALGGSILSNQVQYSLLDHSAECELLPFAASHDRVIIAFSPLAQGLLSGTFHGSAAPADQVRRGNSLFAPENIERTQELIDLLRDVASAHSATPAQIALAWVIRHPSVTAIPGASSLDQLESNVAAAEIELTNDEYEALRKASLKVGAVTTATAWDQPILPALKHTARGAWYVAKTARHDYQTGARSEPSLK